MAALLATLLLPASKHRVVSSFQPTSTTKLLQGVRYVRNHHYGLGVKRGRRRDRAYVDVNSWDNNCINNVSYLQNNLVGHHLYSSSLFLSTSSGVESSEGVNNNINNDSNHSKKKEGDQSVFTSTHTSSSTTNRNTGASGEDTIFALSSGGGGSTATAVAVIRLTGPHSHEALRILLTKSTDPSKLSQTTLPKPRLSSLRTIYDPSPFSTSPKVTVNPLTNPTSSNNSPPTYSNRNPLDSSLLLLFQAPKSFTGEDCVEIHAHGSRAVVNDILASLSILSRPPYNLPIRPAERGEFTQRAYGSGKLGLVEVEALADLIVADTAKQRLQALRQLDGRLSLLYEGWRTDLVKGLAHAEAVIDFGDDEDLAGDEDYDNNDEYDDNIDPYDDDGGMGVWGTIRPHIMDLRIRMEHHLSDANRGEILRDGVKVAIVGPPNAGKSSLLNLLANREAAIVSPIAGTTRDVIEVTLDLGGVRCIVSDTAGVREDKSHNINDTVPDNSKKNKHYDPDSGTIDVIEAEGIKRAIQVAADAHVIVGMVDATDGNNGLDVLNDILQFKQNDSIKHNNNNGHNKQFLFIRNKIDLLRTPPTESTSSSNDNNDGPCSHTQSNQSNHESISIVGKYKMEEFHLSCETNAGVDPFIEALTQKVLARVSGGDEEVQIHGSVDDDSAVITRTRHRNHVELAVEALKRFEVLSLEGFMALDMAAEELRLAASELGRITGAVDVEDVLDVLFKDFCIGK